MHEANRSPVTKSNNPNGSRTVVLNHRPSGLRLSLFVKFRNFQGVRDV